MQGEPLTSAPTTVGAVRFLDVKVSDAERVVLDELPARFDDITHQPREDLVRNVGLRDFDAQKRAVRGIQRRFPKLLGIHLAKPLVALSLQSPATDGEHR